MNSEPSLFAGHKVMPSATTAKTMVRNLALSTAAMIGRYSQIRTRFRGFLCSGTIRPRTKITIRAGTSVTDSSAAAAMEKVLV